MQMQMQMHVDGFAGAQCGVAWPGEEGEARRFASLEGFPG